MAQDNSFDIVSKVDLQEVRNAIDQAAKEVHQRFDLKNTNSEIRLEGNDSIQLASSDEYKLEAVKDILGQKLVKRGVSLKNLTYGKVEPAAGKSVRQKINYFLKYELVVTPGPLLQALSESKSLLTTSGEIP